ncbi:MAG TPA: hypothetical protein VFZ14_19730 [Burkholderiales bacterium]|nr:hypothetical protein [Burkholderiales bacterium]
MLLAIKIAVLYGVPVLAVLIAIVWFVVLFRRVRRGATSRRRAGALYVLTLLLPFAAVLVIWATAEISSYLAVGGNGYVWDARVTLDVLTSLLPIAVYVGAPIVLLAVAFWLTLAFAKPGAR